MANEMPLDAIERLDKAVERLERIVLGAEDIGLVGLNQEQRQLRADLDKLLRRRPNPIAWAAGYFCFVMAFSVTIKEIREFFDISPIMALAFGMLLIGFAFILFFVGFGWLDASKPDR